MHEYLMTILAEERRRELLAETRADTLAREARAGRPSWWQRRFVRPAPAPTEPSPVEPDPGEPISAAVNGHMAASVLTMR